MYNIGKNIKNNRNFKIFNKSLNIQIPLFQKTLGLLDIQEISGFPGQWEDMPYSLMTIW